MTTTFKKSSASMMLALAAGVTFMTAVSCKEGHPEGEWIPTPPDSSSLGKIDHFISREQMTRFATAFKLAKDTILSKSPEFFIPTSEAFNKEWLLKLLKDDRCVGIRIYYGVKTKTPNGNEFRLMIVGVDQQGKDLYISRGSKLAGQADEGEEGGLEWGQCEPPCSDERDNP